MLDRKLQDSLDNMERALDNLEHALTIPTSGELVFEGTIHRFEITIELFWKTLSRALQHEGSDVYTPLESVREAFAYHWLQDEPAWLDMIDRRNLTTHECFSEAIVRDNYESVKQATPTIRTAFDLLRARYTLEV